MKARALGLSVAALLASLAPGASGKGLGRAAIVTDRSGSVEKGDGASCQAVGRLTGDMLSARGLFAPGGPLASVSHDVERESAVAVELWGTASDATPGTPVQMGEEPFRFVAGVMEDPEAMLGPRNKKAAAVAQAAEARCKQHARPQGTSPLYSALAAAVGSLLNNCPQGDECLLVIQSDLKETREPGLRSAIDNVSKGRPPGSAPLPVALDLGGRVSVLLCGYGASTDVLSEQARRAVVTFWKERILVHHERWVEQSLCPGFATR